MLNTNAIGIIDSISAMHLREKKTPKCNHYFERTNKVDESSRAAMINWLCQISDALSLQRETVRFAMSLLDRYLSSCSESAELALANKHRFQLASITTYYIAVKINEPVQLSIEMLVKLCRGFYEHSAIVSMEKDILVSLEWCVSSPTAMDFVREMLALLPSADRCIINNVEKYLAEVTKASRYSTFAPSTVAAASVALSFRESNICASSEQVGLWEEMCKILELNTSREFLDVQQHLVKSCHLEHPASIEHAITTLPRRASYVNLGDSSSPVSVNASAA